MRRLLKAFSRYRPRVPTVLLLASIAALLVLANLSDELRGRVSPTSPLSKAELSFDVRQPPPDEVLGIDALWNLTYGWPLRWRQYVVGFGYIGGVKGSYYSPSRLAANVAIWLLLLAMPAAASEWLVRRYRPRFRWSLRTMLVAVGLVAACCGLFVMARNRANVEEALTATIQGRHGRVWVERWGPTWLELVGADQLCGQIVGADLTSGYFADEDIEQLLARLARLPKLKFLFLGAERLTPAMVHSLGEMAQLQMLKLRVEATPGLAGALTEALIDKPQLRILSLELYDGTNHHLGGERTSREFLADIGKLTQLESLHLVGMVIAGDNLALLADLANLKAISFTQVIVSGDTGEPISPLAAMLSALRRLEHVEFRQSNIDDRDLWHMANLPNLKSLLLTGTDATSAGLAACRALESLETLSVDGELLSAAVLGLLQAVKQLRALHISEFMGPCDPGVPLKPNQLPDVPAAERDDCARALEALRQLHPALVIDSYTVGNTWAELHITLQPFEVRRLASLARGMVRWRQEKQSQKQAATGSK